MEPRRRIEIGDGLCIKDFRDAGKSWEYSIEIDPKYGRMRYMNVEELRKMYEAIDRLLWERVNDTTDS